MHVLNKYVNMFFLSIVLCVLSSTQLLYNDLANKTNSCQKHHDGRYMITNVFNKLYITM